MNVCQCDRPILFGAAECVKCGRTARPHSERASTGRLARAMVEVSMGRRPLFRSGNHTGPRPRRND